MSNFRFRRHVMPFSRLWLLLVSAVMLEGGTCQQYDFAAEITRQCLVPDPVGLLDCVENKVTLPYLTSWVDCTNSLGENVKTSADIINYRCKSVWEGKGVIPEVFFIKDCVIEKTGLPAKNVSAEVLGAYKECEAGSANTGQTIKSAPVQQMRSSAVVYNNPTQQQQQYISNMQPPSASVSNTGFTSLPVPSEVPVQQFQPMTVKSPASTTVQRPIQSVVQSTIQRQGNFNSFQGQNQVQAPAQFPSPGVRTTFIQPSQISSPPTLPVQQSRVPVSSSNFQQRPVQQFQVPFQTQQAPIQQVQVPFQNQPQAPVYQSQLQFQRVPVQQAPVQQAPIQQAPNAPYTNVRMSGYQRQPYSQQFFAIYPQPPLPNQQTILNRPVASQKTAASPSFVTQQQIQESRPIANPSPAGPHMYSYQIYHPQQQIM